MPDDPTKIMVIYRHPEKRHGVQGIRPLRKNIDHPIEPGCWSIVAWGMLKD